MRLTRRRENKNGHETDETGKKRERNGDGNTLKAVMFLSLGLLLKQHLECRNVR